MSLCQFPPDGEREGPVAKGIDGKCLRIRLEPYGHDSPESASHKLNVLPSARPIGQKVRRFHPVHHQIIQTEVDNLLKARFIKEVKYLKWLANVVVVPKKGGKWRVCVDCTDLNDACPKDSFPLPRIDQIVDSSAGHDMLSFLDAFSSYHQIPMYPSDAEKTSIITPPTGSSTTT